MTTLTLGTGRPLAAFALSFRNAIDAVASGIRASHEYERMYTLSDRQLAALGIARQDLPRVVFERNFR